MRYPMNHNTNTSHVNTRFLQVLLVKYRFQVKSRHNGFSNLLQPTLKTEISFSNRLSEGYSAKGQKAAKSVPYSEIMDGN